MLITVSLYNLVMLTLGKVYKIHIETPSTEWNLVLPYTLQLSTLLNLVIQQEQLDTGLNWCIVDMRSDTVVVNTDQSLDAYEATNRSNNRLDIELKVTVI